MIHSGRPPPPRTPSPYLFVGLGTMAAPLLFFAFTTGLGPLVGLYVVVVTLAITGAAWVRFPELGRVVPAIPVLAGYGLLAATSTPSYSTELFAGIGGLAVIFAIALAGSAVGYVGVAALLLVLALAAVVVILAVAEREAPA